MQNVRQLDKTIDSLERFRTHLPEEQKYDLGIYLNVIKYMDSINEDTG
jgi:hypothetical protein